MGLKQLFDKIEPHFTHGGKLEKYYPLFEATATPGRSRAARRTSETPSISSG